MSRLLAALAGGDRRSIGRSGAVVRQVLADPARFAEIVGGLSDADPIVRLRCADAAEKVSLVHPGWLAPHKQALLDLAMVSVEPAVRWHLAQMLPRLQLDRRQRRRVVVALYRYLDDPSRIVKTFAMQALADLAGSDDALRRELLPRVEEMARTGSPAMRARARKLLVQLTAT